MSLKIIVIGGLSAGPSAAAKARRQNENASITLFEKCKNISYATCGIPYALSGVISDREKLLVVEADLLKKRFQIDVHLEEEVIEILPEEHIVKTNKGVYEYDKLVYATGAKTIIPKIKNIDKVSNWSACRTLEDYDRLMKKGAIDQANHITVIGAGLIGVEVAENLQKLGKKVTLIEGGGQVLPMWDSKFRIFAQNVLRDQGVEVVSNTFVNEFYADEGRIVGIPLEEKELKTDFVIISIGIKPNTDLLTAKGAEHLSNGALKVNEKMETTLLDIYAAGDCASVKNLITGEHDFLPLGTHSNKGGRTAGANAAGGNEIFKGGYKTAIIKVFQYTLGRTGLNASDLIANGIDYKSSLIVTGVTPGYYPNKKEIIVEIYYAKDTGKILGCEAFGEAGVDKRIDVMSTAIYGGLTLDDLQNLDLAYAPPFSPAKDPVIVSGFMAGNASKNNYEEMSSLVLKKMIAELPKDEYQIIDVRGNGEIVKEGRIKNSIAVALDSLRDIELMLDKDKLTIVYCAKGLRGYIGSLLLKSKGFKNVKNLSGGYFVWSQLNSVEEKVLEATS